MYKSLFYLAYSCVSEFSVEMIFISQHSPFKMEQMLMTLILLSRKENWGNLRAFMKMFANYYWIKIWKVLIGPSWIFSLTKWQSISMFLVLSWKTRLTTMRRASWLSQYNRTACECSSWKSFSNDTNQIAHTLFLP